MEQWPMIVRVFEIQNKEAFIESVSLRGKRAERRVLPGYHNCKIVVSPRTFTDDMLDKMKSGEEFVLMPKSEYDEIKK